MLDSNPPHDSPTPVPSSGNSENQKMSPTQNDKRDSSAENDVETQTNGDLNGNGVDNLENNDLPIGTLGSGPDVNLVEPDQDAETVALSRLRCTSIRTEEIADREKQKKERREQRQNRCADYPGLAFGSAAFGSETMMKFNIIKNELHNIMRSQLKRVDGEVAALSQRIKALDENLAKSEEYIKTATAALADAVAMEITENQDHSEENNNPLSQFDAQMAILEGRLLQAQYLASKASSQTIITTNNSENSEELVTVDNNIVSSSSNTPQAAEKPPPKLRRPFPVP